LKVIGRNSAFQFRDSKDDAATVGRKLGVAHLLEGSVRRAGDVVRINAQLILASDGSTQWSQSYDRPYTDLFKLQDEITQAVAGALKTRLLATDAAVQSDRPPGGSLEAYNAYLRGNFYYDRNSEADFRKAIDAYTSATRLDTHYALAWARLSQAWLGLSGKYLGGGAGQQAYAQARAAADTALSLAPDLAAAQVAHATLLSRVDFDWASSEAAYRRAAQLAPNDAFALHNLGILLAQRGQLEQAVAVCRQALATEPLNGNLHIWLGTYLSALGRLDEAEQATRKGIELSPIAESFFTQLALIGIQRGDAAAALEAARQEPAGVWRNVALALAAQIGADRVAADATLKTMLDQYGDLAPYQIAETYALRRDPDQAFAWLDHAWAAHDVGVTTLLFDPILLRYRNDPRFAAVCKKVGLPSTTEAKALP
jgi:Tfp pilus assembly protein PilF